ncbi:hypothetical protein FQA39_LY00676 [Lamprigera yunnana]|nr:hypothetical protein FQA39_LY00676 [Lamprigera yunnana]
MKSEWHGTKFCCGLRATGRGGRRKENFPVSSRTVWKDKKLNISTETLNLKREVVLKVYKQSRVAKDSIPSATSPLPEINDNSASELNKSPNC